MQAVQNRRQRAILRAISKSPHLKRLELANQLKSDEFATIIDEEIVRAGLPLNQVNQDLLAKGINYRPAAEVEKALADSFAWLGSSLGGRPYALIMEPHDETRRAPFRGTHWLAHKVVRGIGYAPTMFISKDMVDPLRIRPAYNKGVRDFVFFDDGTYSGEYVMQIIRTFNDVTLYLKDVRLHLATGFASPKARALVGQAQTTARRLGSMKFYSPQTMKNVRSFLESVPANRRDKLRRLLTADELDFHDARRAVREARRQKTPSPEFKLPPASANLAAQMRLLDKPMTVLAHKVPNAVSVPGFITALLDQHHTAPYKKVSPSTLYAPPRRKAAVVKPVVAAAAPAPARLRRQ